jgi:hypothetical protein
MPKQFKLEQSTQMGQNVVGVNITGDKRRQEPETFRIHFPFGDVEVTRATDGENIGKTDYWIHIYVNNPTNPNYYPQDEYYPLPGQIKAARLDQTDKHASESNLGDFERAELYHLAVRVGAGALPPKQ